MTEVSVVIPSRNRWPLLQGAVASALSQVQVDHEVIVVLDGSTDESARRLAAIGDRRLSVISLAARSGISAARNAGIAAARGDWIAVRDDDDRWSRDKLRHALSAGAGCDFVYGAAVIVDGADRVIAGAQPPEPQALLRDLLRVNVMPAGTSNVVVRRELLQAVGGFDERYVHLADWDAWIRLAERGKGAASQHTDVAYLEHATNLSTTDAAGLFRDFAVLESRHADLAREHGVRIDRACFDRWVSRGQLRAGRTLFATVILLRSAVRDRNARNVTHAAETLFAPQRVLRPRGAPPAPDWVQQ